MHAEDEDKDEDTYHSVDTQSDASDSGTDENQCEDNTQLEKNQEHHHRLFCLL
jgi:hypothetical protein